MFPLTDAWKSEMDTFTSSLPPNDLPGLVAWLEGIMSFFVPCLLISDTLTTHPGAFSGSERLDSKDVARLLAPVRRLPHWVTQFARVSAAISANTEQTKNLQLPLSLSNSLSGILTITAHTTKAISALTGRLLDVIEESPRYKKVLEPLLQNTLNLDLLANLMTGLASNLDSVIQNKLLLVLSDGDIADFSRLTIDIYNSVVVRAHARADRDLLAGYVPCRVFGSGEWVPVVLHSMNLYFKGITKGEPADTNLDQDEKIETITVEQQALLWNMMLRILSLLEDEDSGPRRGLKEVFASARGQQLLSQVIEGYKTCAGKMAAIRSSKERFEAACAELVCNATYITVACCEKRQETVSADRFTQTALAVVDFGDSWMKLAAEVDAFGCEDCEDLGKECCAVSYLSLLIFYERGKRFLQESKEQIPSATVKSEEISALLMAIERLCTIAGTNPAFVRTFQIWKSEDRESMLPCFAAMPMAHMLVEICYMRMLGNQLVAEGSTALHRRDAEALHNLAGDAFDAAVRLGFILARMDPLQLEMLRRFHMTDLYGDTAITGAIGKMETPGIIAQIIMLLLLEYCEANHTENGSVTESLSSSQEPSLPRSRSDRTPSEEALYAFPGQLEAVARGLSLLHLIGAMPVPFQISPYSIAYPKINGVVMYFNLLRKGLIPCLIYRDRQALRRVAEECEKVVVSLLKYANQLIQC